MLHEITNLSDFYPFKVNDNSDLINEFILCEDDDSMASDFTFSSMLIHFLLKKKVCHVLLNRQSLIHYEYIIRKSAGMDMTDLINKGMIYFYHVDNNNNNNINININGSNSDNSNNNKNSKDNINDYSRSYSIINTLKNNVKSNNAEILLIDDLNAFELLFDSPECLISNELKNYFNCICCYASSIKTNIIKYYENLATILIKITSLSSGYSQDVHGMISISQNLSTKILYYKLIDGNIIVIPKGKD